MKRQLVRVIACMAVISAALAQFPTNVAGQTSAAPQTLGIGFQSAFPAYGASVIYNAPSGASVQGILGAFADLKMYAGRVRYRFQPNGNVHPYAFGTLGLWSYDGYRAGTYSVEKTTESVFGVGGGAGIEYFFAGMPSLGFNAEIGFGSAKFKDIDYNFSAIGVGVGLHYYIR